MDIERETLSEVMRSISTKADVDAILTETKSIVENHRPRGPLEGFNPISFESNSEELGLAEIDRQIESLSDQIAAIHLKEDERDVNLPEELEPLRIRLRKLREQKFGHPDYRSQDLYQY